MNRTINPAIVNEYHNLLREPGVRDVSHWQLPNNDVRFDEDEALDFFNKHLDEAFDATTEAIDSIVARFG